MHHSQDSTTMRIRIHQGQTRLSMPFRNEEWPLSCAKTVFCCMSHETAAEDCVSQMVVKSSDAGVLETTSLVNYYRVSTYGQDCKSTAILTLFYLYLFYMDQPSY